MKWDLYHFDTVDSTNRVALQYQPFSAITANHQTGGRGRMGRVWESVPGNLYLSIVLPDQGSQSPLMAFIIGVAVADALADFDVRLKWPNDILIQGAKVGGILLERVEGKMIAGIGINVACAPKSQMMYPTADLGGQVPAQKVAGLILNRISKELEYFEKQGFEPVLSKWRRLSYFRKGERMQVRLPNETVEGVFGGVDENGVLLLGQEGGSVRKVSAGDVFKL